MGISNYVYWQQWQDCTMSSPCLGLGQQPYTIITHLVERQQSICESDVYLLGALFYNHLTTYARYCLLKIYCLILFISSLVKWGWVTSHSYARLGKCIASCISAQIFSLIAGNALRSAIALILNLNHLFCN
ncbi:hypothetical protein NPIL_468821 [Nephila pilipes]|uniref:Uncharacterized protein n=1 Tax=Nephila pilipes TaxID=299642 RepID=A0A8X6MZ22_NEPPI|nr:hypothetical protein NPIL_468821 [Nephila pilipes]